MIRALIVAVALAVVAAPLARSARADDTDQDDPDYQKARKLTIEGRKLFDLGKFKQSLARFEAAYEAKPIPGLLFNIGQCHRNLDELDAAIFSFKKYLRLLPDAPNRDAVQNYIDELEREKEKRSAAALGLAGPDRDPDEPREVDPPPRGTPIYKKWWFWGGLAAVGAGVVGTAVILSSGGAPGTDLGNIDISQ